MSNQTKNPSPTKNQITHWREEGTNYPLCHLTVSAQFSVEPTCKRCLAHLARRLVAPQPSPQRTHYPTYPCGAQPHLPSVRRGKPTCKRCLRIGPMPYQKFHVDAQGRVCEPDQAVQTCRQLRWTPPKIGEKP